MLTMSSSSSEPKIGTRMFPYSASRTTLRRASSGTETRLVSDVRSTYLR